MTEPTTAEDRASVLKNMSSSRFSPPTHNFVRRLIADVERLEAGTKKWTDSLSATSLELVKVENELETARGLLDEIQRIRPCPSGCGCTFLNDADASECACDGPCCTDEWWKGPVGETRVQYAAFLATKEEA